MELGFLLLEKTLMQMEYSTDDIATARHQEKPNIGVVPVTAT